MKVGDKIKHIRLSLGLTMEEFGIFFSTSKGTVNNWEKGRNLPNKKNLTIIAKLGGISVKDLLGEVVVMTEDEKSEIILDALEEYMTINWNLKEFYIKAIKKGLNEIEEKAEAKTLVE